ncbi:hypothetical protein Tco_0739942 [Tanacetum coccineum]
MICDEPWKIHDASLIIEINNKSFEITDLKAELQEKSIVVNELKQLLATLKEKSQMTPNETTNHDSRFQKIKDGYMSLAFKVSSLVKEREHLKLVYKNIYDSIKKTRVQNKLKTDSLQQKLNDKISKNAKLRAKLQVKFSELQLNQNGTSVNTKFAKPSTSGNKLYYVTPLPKTKFILKVIEKNDMSKTVTSYLHTNKIIEKCTKCFGLGLLRIESETINAYFKNNRAMHRDYLKVTKEHVETLQELLEQARALKPSNENLDYACKLAKRIQKLLVSRLVPNQAALTSANPPLKNDLDLLFQLMFDEYFKQSPSAVSITISAATLPPPDTPGVSFSTTIEQDAPYLSTSPTTKTTTNPIQATNVENQIMKMQSLIVIPLQIHLLLQ